MDIKFEIGDVFKIDYHKIKTQYPSFAVCNHPNMTFTITRFSKSGLSVYYGDNRTNPKCYCKNCSSKGLYGEKCIGISSIIFVESKKQHDRNKKLKCLAK